MKLLERPHVIVRSTTRVSFFCSKKRQNKNITKWNLNLIDSSTVYLDFELAGHVCEKESRILAWFYYFPCNYQIFVKQLIFHHHCTRFIIVTCFIFLHHCSMILPCFILILCWYFCGFFFLQRWKLWKQLWCMRCKPLSSLDDLYGSFNCWSYSCCECWRQCIGILVFWVSKWI